MEAICINNFSFGLLFQFMEKKYYYLSYLYGMFILEISLKILFSQVKS